MLRPGSSDYFRFDGIRANGDKDHFLQKINYFYRETTGSDPTITRELFDVDGNVLPEDSTDFVS